jgi:hypothetical protein
MAMTFDPTRNRVTVYCNGIATPTQVTDPVAKDVFHYDHPVASNPYCFPWPVFSPRSLALKFNGYNVESTGVYEHWLRVDTEKGRVSYHRSCPDDAEVKADYRVNFDVRRDGTSLLPKPFAFIVTQVAAVDLPDSAAMRSGDEIITSLEVREGGWRRVGTEVRYRLREGAPFTFGRALGLGDEPIDHGTQLFIDGVAVFNRVLSREELASLAFAGQR